MVSAFLFVYSITEKLKKIRVINSNKVNIIQKGWDFKDKLWFVGRKKSPYLTIFHSSEYTSTPSLLKTAIYGNFFHPLIINVIWIGRCRECIYAFRKAIMATLIPRPYNSWWEWLFENLELHWHKPAKMAGGLFL